LDIIKLQRYSFHRLIILISSLFFLVISINSISSYINGIYKDGYSGRVEINIKNNFTKQGKLIKSRDLEALKLSFPSGVISYMNEQDTAVQTKNAVYAVKAVLSGEKLDDFSGLEILRGTFFNSDQYKYGNRVAVISDIMAQKLFMTHHVIGNEIFISGVKYKITGLYKSKTSILSELASDGAERVYIPFYSLSKSSAETVNTIYIKDKNLEDTPFNENIISQALKERLNADPKLYKINDFYNINTYTTQPLSAFVFVIGIFCICVVIKYFLKFVKFGLSYIKKDLENDYFLKVLIKNSIRILVFLVLTAAFVVSIIMLFRTVSFNGSIPYEYIPADNVFDLSFYAGQFNDSIRSINNSAWYVPTQLEMLSRYSLLAIYILMMFLIINFIMVLSAVKLNKIVCVPFTRQMTALAASVFIGVGLSFIFCLICGIGYSLPVKGMVVLVLFFIISSNINVKNKIQKHAMVVSPIRPVTKVL